VRLNIKPLWSAFNFFTLYANADGVKAKQITASDNMLDRYILAKAKAAVQAIEKSLDAYDTTGATEASTQFFDVLNNWYIRRSRPRFWAEEMSADKQAAYDTLFTVLNLLCVATAPLLPFVTEAVYRGLNGASESVHLQDFPDVGGIADDAELVTDMDCVQDICNAAHAIRNLQKIRTRQPLAKIIVASKKLLNLDLLKSIIADEANVEEVEMSGMPEDYAQTDKVIIKPSGLKLRLIPLGKDAKIGQIIAESKKGKHVEVSDDVVRIADEDIYRSKGEWRWGYKPHPANPLPYMEVPQISGSDLIVVLDNRITPELEQKGRARDLVRMIQQARKDAGLHVADRITLGLDVPSEFKSALATHGDFIAAQTLATSWKEGSAGSAQQVKQELDGAEFIIGLSKVA
jgi:isoleucyl-tRNA synthetase